jgi:L-rhamnose mutarotase
MIRVGRHALIKPGCVDQYVESHRRVWPDVLSAIQRAGITNYTIFRRGRTLFSYFEVEDLSAASEVLAADEACQLWQDTMAPLMDAPDPAAPWTILDEVFHTG